MKFYNTLSTKIEEFKPSQDEISMYVCGITPYSPPHIGHAMRGVIFDVLKRYFIYKGYKVKHIENFTDIDDKMIENASRLKITTNELAQKNIDVYLGEMDSLNISRADLYPKATEEISYIIKIIERLIETDYAYESNGDVYFRVSKFSTYGKLSHRNISDLLAGARIEPSQYKEDDMDFALWKSKKPNEPSWPSPWGEGRPGWHIECSAMSLKYLGNSIDIHGGGQDLIFPHHENEIAQTEAYTSIAPMAKFWIHNGLLRLGETKMSKSIGNIISLYEALENHSVNALRLFFLSSYYRSPLVYSEENLEAHEKGAERLITACSPNIIENPSSIMDAAKYEDEFITEMDNDFNTPRAIATLFDLAREINRCKEIDIDVSKAQLILIKLASILGLSIQSNIQKQDTSKTNVVPVILSIHNHLLTTGLNELAEAIKLEAINCSSITNKIFESEDTPTKTENLIDEQSNLIDTLIKTRNKLRALKEFEIADQIRTELEASSIVLEDKSDGTTWKLK